MKMIAAYIFGLSLAAVVGLIAAQYVNEMMKSGVSVIVTSSLAPVSK